MITAVDSSVLLAIFNGEQGGDKWMEALIRARGEGRLIICEIVYAEISPGFVDFVSLDQQLELMGINTLPIGKETAWTAGHIFHQYRQCGGPREHLIPDFLIASHALVQADRLAAIDRGYLRRWFTDLELLRCFDPGSPLDLGD